MAHTPVNHPMRPLYRVIAALTGLYVLLFGVVGFVQTKGTEPFAQTGATALGLRTNLAFSALSMVAGAVIVLAAAIGRNVDKAVNMLGAVLFLVVGTAMMALLRTDGNILNFSIETCMVSYVIGMVLLTAGLYGKVGSAEPARAAEALRVS
jgi:hypothetical protein